MKNLIKLKHLYKLKEAGVEYFEGFSSNENEIKMPKELDELKKICLNCSLCDLSKTRINVVFGEGNIKADLMFIGEAPGAEEDKTGRPFVGRAGKLLTKIILKVLNLDETKRADYLRKLIILARLRPKLYNKIESFFKEKKMPIVFDTKNDPLYHKGWNEAWSKAKIESTINTAIMMIKEFNLPVSEVAKKLNIDVNVLQKALNDTK